MEQTPLQMIGYRQQDIRCCFSCGNVTFYEDEYRQWLCRLIDEWIDPIGICEKYEKEW
jgi:hypothetical protein